MHLRHALSSALRRITRRYPWLRHLSLVSTLLTFFWAYTIWRGERATFASHMQSCLWHGWEEWPRHATPHHLVFIADPQLVDPHTYPGRPWPLSWATEKYTDMYMSRNFRLVNERLDPDSIVFLGDLFDGGREWTTARAKPLTSTQREQLVQLEVLDPAKKEGERMGSDGKTDLHAYVHGEKGRWKKWGIRQWARDLDRFSRIFFDHEQLYPNKVRAMLPLDEELADAVSVENGAPNVTWARYGVGGTKARVLKTGLPGNHDLGFGSGVQVTVRDRFESHFGESNQVYVIGNHTFVSLDVLSLSAFDEYVQGEEMTEERRNKYVDLWKPSYDFLEDLDNRGPKAVAESLNQLFPGAHASRGYYHRVHDPTDKVDDRPAEKKSKPELPVVLLSHVPLFRNPDIDCGQQRERGKAIPLSAGYQYQNVLTPTLSNLIAKKIARIGEMAHVFSGDDHDYCDVTHRFNLGRWDEETNKENVVLRTVREITVKSFSWAMGVRQPGVLLVSMWNPVDEMGKTVGNPLPTIQSHLCLLPDQLSIFINYAVFLGWTILLLFIRAVIVGWRNRPSFDADDSGDELTRLALPSYSSRPSSQTRAQGKLSGYATPTKNLASSETKGRQRASSTTTSHAATNDNNLSVQRNYNARTRSVSPAAANMFNSPNSYAMPNLQQKDDRPLIDKAGYYSTMRWQDPDESDEESHLGDYDHDDSQGKGMKKGKWKREKNRARKAVDEFGRSLLFVAVPSALWYGFLIRNG